MIMKHFIRFALLAALFIGLELQARPFTPSSTFIPALSDLAEKIRSDDPDYRQANGLPPTTMTIDEINQTIRVQTRFLIVGGSEDVIDRTRHDLEEAVNLWNRDGQGRQLLCYRVFFEARISTYEINNFNLEKYQQMVRGEYASSKHVILAVDTPSIYVDVKYLYDSQAISRYYGQSWNEEGEEDEASCAYFGKNIIYDNNCVKLVKELSNGLNAFDASNHIDISKISAKNITRSNSQINAQGQQSSPSFLVYSPYYRSPYSSMSNDDFRLKIMAHGFGRALGMQENFNHDQSNVNNITNLGNSLSGLTDLGSNASMDSEDFAFTAHFPTRVFHSTLAEMFKNVEGVECSFNLSFNTIWQTPLETCVDGSQRTYGYDDAGDLTGLFVSRPGEFGVTYRYSLDSLSADDRSGDVRDLSENNSNQAYIDVQEMNYLYNSGSDSERMITFFENTETDGTYPVTILFDDMITIDDESRSEELDGKVVFRINVYKSSSHEADGYTQAREYFQGYTDQWRNSDGIIFLEGSYLEEAIFHSFDYYYGNPSYKTVSMDYLLGVSQNPQDIEYIKNTPFKFYLYSPEEVRSNEVGNYISEETNNFAMGPSIFAQYCYPEGQDELYGLGDLGEIFPDMIDISELYFEYDNVRYERMDWRHEYYSMGLSVTNNNVQTSHEALSSGAN